MTSPAGFSTLEQWLEWQSELHPSAIDLGLERVRAVAHRLGVEQPAACVITVGGTNGKGSSVAMLESVLLCAGFSTCAYTSPHLNAYNERVRLDGLEAEDALFVDAFSAIEAVRGDISLTYFEWGTLAALWIARQQAVDVCLLEVGLGGRLDAVNLVDAAVALITSISIDHTEWLGDTRELIALEKLGIARPFRPLVCADPTVPANFVAAANAMSADLRLSGRDFGYVATDADTWEWSAVGATPVAGLPRPALFGGHQLQNAAGVLAVFDALGFPKVSLDSIICGLNRVKLSGRFERIGGDVEVILDVAHNYDGSLRLVEALRQTRTSGETWCLLGVLADKDARHMLSALDPQVDHWVLSEPQASRRLSLDLLKGVAHDELPRRTFMSAETVTTGLEMALSEMTEGDRLVVTGSFYTVGEARALLVHTSRRES